MTESPSNESTPTTESDDGRPDAGKGPEAVSETVAGLLAEVDEIRQSAGDQFDPQALARQSELLERAHDALAAALEDVERR